MQKRCKKPMVKNPNNGKCTRDKKVIKLVQCRKDKVKQVMGEYKQGLLKSHDNQVKNVKQAIAIALNIAKKSC